eukprot:10035097-Lingulodinium_polyedra.AAC.1
MLATQTTVRIEPTNPQSVIGTGGDVWLAPAGGQENGPFNQGNNCGNGTVRRLGGRMTGRAQRAN